MLPQLRSHLLVYYFDDGAAGPRYRGDVSRNDGIASDSVKVRRRKFLVSAN